MILNCNSCKPHVYQDKRYGKNKRVHNKCETPSGANHTVWRCTVCKETQNVNQ